MKVVDRHRSILINYNKLHDTMKIHSNAVPANSLTWYVKYVGGPIIVGIAMSRLFDCFFRKRRNAALQGKVVVITGASSGIGEALAHVFYDNGSKVVLSARRKSELERVKQDLVKKQSNTPSLEPVVLELDLADFENLEPFVQKVYDVCGHIDILINNGGISQRGSVLHTKIEVDKKIMAVNYFGAIALTKACLPKMVERKSGHVVFISSVQGLIAIPDRSAYAASKHAMQAFGDALRAEMHQHNVDVTMISPGYINTPISLNAYTGSGDTYGVMDPSTANGFTPEYAANKMVDAIVSKQKELTVSQFVPHLAIFLRHTMPSIFFWAMTRRAIKTTTTIS